MNPKQLSLLKVLSEQSNPISAAHLAETLNVSIRSIKKYIADIKQTCPGAIIASRAGYCANLAIVGKELEKEHSVIPQDSAARVRFILRKIIREQHPIDEYDFCDTLYISMSTLKQEITKAKKLMNRFDLRLVHRDGVLSIEGQETNKRKLLSELFYQESDKYYVSIEMMQKAFPDLDVVFIRDIVLLVFEQSHYFVNDFALISIVLHISIALERMKQCADMLPTSTGVVELKSDEINLANKIIQRLEMYFEISYNEEETWQLTFLLATRAALTEHETLEGSELSQYVDPGVIQLAQEMVQSVMDNYGIELCDEGSFLRFTLHVRNLIARSKNSAFSKFPFKDEIKREWPMFYDIAISVSGILQQKTGVRVPDDEIAYIALHVGSAVASRKAFSTKITATIFCPNYYNLNTRLAGTISKHFADDLLIADIFTDESDLEKLPNIDFLIAVLPISRVVQIPIARIGIFAGEADFIRIREIIEQIKLQKAKKSFSENLETLIVPELFENNQTIVTEASAVRHMVETLKSLKYVNDGFENEILERENMYSTAFDLFALPHSMKMNANKTALSILINESGIEWGDKYVKLVAMLCFNVEQRHVFHEVFDPITTIFSNRSNIERLIKCKDYYSFIEAMVEMYDGRNAFSHNY
jgi:Transcriptional antiterminator